MNRLSRFLVVSVLLCGFTLAGCAPIGGRRDSGGDGGGGHPSPLTSPIAEAARKSFADYAARTAAAARATADKADTFKGWAPAFDFGSNLNKDARVAAFAAYEDALTDRLKGKSETLKGVPYSADELKSALLEAADGWDELAKRLGGGR